MATTMEVTTVNGSGGFIRNCIDGVYIHQAQITTTPFVTTSNPFVTDFTENGLTTDASEPSHPKVGSSVSPVMLTIYTAVFFFGVVGNTLVIATLRSSPHMRTVTNCFLLSLAISDMLQALICIPISITGQTLERFVFGQVMCKTFIFIMGISVSVSTFTMLAISLERYHAICKPLKSRGWQTKSHAYKVIGSIWLFSLLFMSPYFIFSHLKYRPIAMRQECRQACRLNFGHYDAEAKRAWYVITVLLLFLLPGIIMAVSYFLVCRQIYKGFQFHAAAPPTQSSMSMKLLAKCETNDAEKTGTNGSQKYEKKSGLSIKQNLDVPHNDSGALNRQRSVAYQSKNQLESKKRIIRMLIVVVIFFFICWAPLFIVNLWQGFDERGANRAVGSVISIIHLFSFISSCINPIIYCFMNLKFRQSFVKAFTCCLPQRCITCIQSAPANQQTTNNMDKTMTSEVCLTPIMRRNPNTSGAHRNATTSTASTTTISRSTDQSFSSKASPGKSKSGYGQL